MATSELPHINTATGNKLTRGVLGVVDITFMVLAVAAPMAIVVAMMPIAFALGNGPGVAGAYALSGIAITLFAIGYVRLVPHIKNAGAFYAIIASAFGKVVGLGCAYIALASYLGLCSATVGALSFFTTEFFASIGLEGIHWGIIALVYIGLLGVLSYFRIDFTARILTIALGAEVIAIVCLDVAILFNEGLISPSLVFSPSVVFAPGLGIALIYAFTSVIGFEATAIYQEEVREPEKTIPRATYTTILVICLFYIFTAYSFVVASGSEIAQVANEDPGNYVFNLAEQYIGATGVFILSFLVLTSAFAAVLGLFNNSARYVFALARDNVLPSRLSKTRSKNGAPFNAGLPILLGLAVTVSLFALAGLDPLLSLTTALSGFGALGLMFLLMITSFAIPVYFKQHLGKITVATSIPILAGLFLLAGFIMSVSNYHYLSGTDNTLINSLPAAFLVLFAIGAIQALNIKQTNPAVYEGIGISQVSE